MNSAYMAIGRIWARMSGSGASVDDSSELFIQRGSKVFQPDVLHKPWYKLAIVAILAAGVGYLYAHGLLRPEAMLRYRAAHPIAAAGIFVLAYAVTAFTALPTLPLNLASGVFWGPWWGAVLSASGSTIGALAAFYTSRLLLDRPLARYRDYRLVMWIRNEFKRTGWRLIAFLRLNPVFPTGALNYAIGLTGIDARTYLWATFCFLLPPSFVIALIGSEMQTFAVTGDAARWIKILSLVSAALVAFIVLRYAARTLAQPRRDRS
jgi:uncharacterized membrane protein YdjX (TVP38/TMEM64 family)